MTETSGIITFCDGCGDDYPIEKLIECIDAFDNASYLCKECNDIDYERTMKRCAD